MADEYADYYSKSDNYGGGGEQLPSAIYLNEQIVQNKLSADKAQQTANSKANPTSLQPSTPPLNPAIGDMWIDMNVYPNPIYTWTGTEWHKANVTSANEIGTYTTAQIDSISNNVNRDLSNLGDKVSAIDTRTTDSAIVTTMTKSQPFLDKADKSQLGNYLLTATYNTQADLWNARFTSGGGINLLKNSVGYAWDNVNLDKWQAISGSWSQYLGDDCVEAGSGITATTGVIKQTVAGIAGQKYTLTAKVKKGTAGTAYMKLSDGTTFQQVDMISTAAYNYTQIQISGFIPASGTLIVELSATGATGGVIFTAIMLNIGDAGFQWCHAIGELYNTNVKININGIQVKSNVYDGYTAITPSEFSGYYRNTQGIMQKVFTLNKDTTEVAKLSITDPNAIIKMGSLQINYLNGGGHTGWAIIPTT